MCGCGFEFSGDEPEATPTPDEMRSIAARESQQLSAPRSEASVIIATILLCVGIACFTALINLPALSAVNNGVLIFGLLVLSTSFMLYALRFFRAARMRPLAICCGLVLVLLAAASLGLSLIGAACSMGKPGP